MPRSIESLSALPDGRFQAENLVLRWALVGLYAAFALTGVIAIDRTWFIASECLLVVFQLGYAWGAWREIQQLSVPDWFGNGTPFVDTVAVSMVLVAVGDPLHPIWGVYFLVMVDNALFRHGLARVYGLWLGVAYAMVGLGVYLRGEEVRVAYMAVAGVLLLAGVYNFVTYISSERRLRQRLTDVARTDPLTNLLNRRGLEETLDTALALNTNRGLAVLMADVDHFKRYNDEYGHLTADRMLEELGRILRESVGEPDLVGRFGGDEFVVVVPNVTEHDALELAERLRQQIERLGLCTISIGVSVARHGEGSKQFLDRADMALLAAKQGGRNCVRAKWFRPAAQEAA
jgi:diguanylate cyclase (GGDEF)-like protein